MVRSGFTTTISSSSRRCCEISSQSRIPTSLSSSIVPSLVQSTFAVSLVRVPLFPFSHETDKRPAGREPILDGILGCNLVCFQTHSYARHFLSSCVRVMGYEAGLGGVDAKGRITRIAHCLIGIDVEEVEKDR